MMGKENRDKLDLRLRFKHHHSEGEAIPYSKYKYDVIIDHHRITHDAWNREYHPDERVVKVCSIVCHEMVHVWQYFKGDLVHHKNGNLLYKGNHFPAETLQAYFDQPFEEEARGKEEGHMIAFLKRWRELESEGIV
tara:strand:- start:128 stop:535 length:408 start_codon:yes stop_codon:yes gene_type:complete